MAAVANRPFPFPLAEIRVPLKNTTGSDIAASSVVQINPANTDELQAFTTSGVWYAFAPKAIPNGETGYCVVVGRVSVPDAWTATPGAVFKFTAAQTMAAVTGVTDRRLAVGIDNTNGSKAIYFNGLAF